MASPILLCTVGAAWAVVPEAWFFGKRLGSDFTAVHVLTSDNPRLDEGLQQLAAWLRELPVPTSICRVKGFKDLRTEKDHRLFQEVLYRWILAKAPDPGSRYLCLAGGFKTMSTVLQRAATLFGAAEVFHVLCEPNFPTEGTREAATAEEAAEAAQRGWLHYIPLGPEAGWPSLVTLRANQFPLEREETGPFTRLWATDMALSERVEQELTNARRIMASWEDLSQLPFPSLALWSSAHRQWLTQPVDPAADQVWLRQLPKVELHTHLGGFATHGPLLRRVREAARQPHELPPLVEPQPPEGWPLPSKPIALDAYMRLGDANGSKLLKDPGCLRKQCQLLYQAFLDDHVVYAEVRCSPANYANPKQGRSAWHVLCDIRETFQEAMNATDEQNRCHVNLILTATREDGGDRSRIARHLSLAIAAADHFRRGCRVVGVDLAGFERRETRAALFETSFEPVHRVGLAVTVHAGENDDVEGIWQAVFRLHARRLGHALRLKDSTDLLRVVADRGIGVEMCPYANYQIKGFPISPTHDQQNLYPLVDYLKEGLAVTVNTDNIGISQASLSDNFLLLARLNPTLTRLQVLQLLANAVRVSFASVEEKITIFRKLSRVPTPGHTPP